MCSVLFWGVVAYAIARAIMAQMPQPIAMCTDDDTVISNDNNHVHHNDHNRYVSRDGHDGEGSLEGWMFGGIMATHAHIHPCNHPGDDDNSNNNNDADWGSIAAEMYPPLFGIFLLYWIESCCSDTRKYMSNFKDVDGCESYLQRMVERPPHIVMECECYHYETRTRIVTYTDSNGNSRTRYETYTVKVVTYRETCYFEYVAWRDDSGPFHGLSLYSIVKLKMYKLLVWADDASRDAFYRAYSYFQMRNRWRDSHFTHSWHMRLDGYKSNMLSTTDKTSKPWWLSMQCFCLWTVLGFSWCFRRALTNASVEASYTFRKVIRA